MFRKSKEFIRQSTIFYDYGQTIDIVEDLSCEQKSTQRLGALIQEAGWFSRTQVMGNKSPGLDHSTSSTRQETTPGNNDTLNKDQLHEPGQTARDAFRETSQLSTKHHRGSGRVAAAEALGSSHDPHQATEGS